MHKMVLFAQKVGEDRNQLSIDFDVVTDYWRFIFSFWDTVLMEEYFLSLPKG